MDPVSHAIIGLSIHAFHQGPDLGNPALVGTLIGAVAPDFDIITKIKGDYVYLKHHRVESHSLPGIVILSVLITLGLSLFYPSFLFREVFLWTLIGSLSHVIFDLLNSYGVSILYPLNRKKYSLNLINIYDPLILLLSGYVVFFSKRRFYENLIIAFVLFSYLLIKQVNKKILTKKIYQFYQKNQKAEINGVSVMPSDFSVFKWDYIVSTEREYITGEIKPYGGFPTLFKRFSKTSNPIMEKIYDEELGLYFKDFTPFYHVEFKEEKDGIIVKMVDLRYRIRDNFKHHAMFYYNDNAELLRSVFHPFKMDNQIEVSRNATYK